MYLGFFGALQGLFSFGSKRREREEEAEKIQSENHNYVRASITQRGPCPGLNSLANQGYL